MGGDSDTSRSQVPVGDNAWSSQVEVNITGDIEPSSVTVSGEEMLVWRNMNSFPVTIEMENVERTFTLSAGESLAFKPSQGFAYTASGESGTIGEGSVEIG